MQTKEQIRAWMKKKRGSLSKTKREQMARECTKRVVSLKSFQDADEVYIYISYQGEMETRYLIEEAKKAGKKVAAPRISGKEMDFFYFDCIEEMEKNKYGILEPVSSQRAEQEEALIVLPGLAFDGQGNRVGYGGGFYDRYLERHPRCQTIAIGYEFQILDQVPSESFDKKLEAIVTEKRILLGA